MGWGDAASESEGFARWPSSRDARPADSE